MEQFLTWTKGIFENTYQIFQDGQIKGNLMFDTWNNEAHTLFFTRNVRFKANGIFESTTQIFGDNMEFIGVINFEIWQAKATINFQNGEQFAFNFTNGWYTKWNITDFKGKEIYYDSDTSSGRIQTNTDDHLLLVIGLFVREYFSRRLLMLVLFIIFIPMFFRIF